MIGDIDEVGANYPYPGTPWLNGAIAYEASRVASDIIGRRRFGAAANAAPPNAAAQPAQPAAVAAPPAAPVPSPASARVAASSSQRSMPPPSTSLQPLPLTSAALPLHTTAAPAPGEDLEMRSGEDNSAVKRHASEADEASLPKKAKKE